MEVALKWDCSYFGHFTLFLLIQLFSLEKLTKNDHLTVKVLTSYWLNLNKRIFILLIPLKITIFQLTLLLYPRGFKFLCLDKGKENDRRRYHLRSIVFHPNKKTLSWLLPSKILSLVQYFPLPSLLMPLLTLVWILVPSPWLVFLFCFYGITIEWCYG